MKKLILLAAAAFLSPALIASASAQTVSVRVGEPGYSAYAQQRVVTQKRVVVTGKNCRTVTVRTKRANGTIWVRKIRKCS